MSSARSLIASLCLALLLGGGMPTRTIRHALDERHHAQASIVTATYLGPVGPGHASVIIRGSETPITVTVAAGSKTWAPNSIVMVARPDRSNPRHSIVGDPPPSQQGGSGFSLRKIPPGPPPARTYFGYAFPGPIVEAWRYADGSPIELLGTLDGSTDGFSFLSSSGGTLTAGGVGIILGDPTGRVADGALVFSGAQVGGHPVLGVWSPAANRVFHLSRSGLTTVDYISDPGAWGGRVYWFESLYNIDPDLSFTTFTLWTADADLSNPVSLGSAAAIYGASGPLGGKGLMLSAHAAELVRGRTVVRVEFSGAGSSQPYVDGVTGDLAGYPGGGGVVAFRPAFWTGASPITVLDRTAVLGSSYSAMWTATGPWLINAQPPGNVSTSRDGTYALATGTRYSSGFDSDYIAILAPVAAPAGTPAQVFSIEPTPAGYLPDLFFIGW